MLCQQWDSAAPANVSSNYTPKTQNPAVNTRTQHPRIPGMRVLKPRVALSAVCGHSAIFTGVLLTAQHMPPFGPTTVGWLSSLLHTQVLAMQDRKAASGVLFRHMLTVCVWCTNNPNKQESLM